MFAQICVLDLEALELAFTLLPGWLHVCASLCGWTCERVSLQVFARCFLVPGKHIFGFTSQGKWVTWGLFQRAESTDGDHRLFLSLLSVSCVSLSVFSFLNHFILETTMEGREERDKKKNTALIVWQDWNWHSYTEISFYKIVYFRWQSCSVHPKEFNLSTSGGWDAIASLRQNLPGLRSMPKTAEWNFENQACET